MNHYILLALLLATAVNAFTVQPSVLSPQTTRSHNQWRQVSFMASDAEAEAERLREKARQLKEEVAALSGTSVEEVEEATKKEEEAKQVAVSKDGTFYDDEVAEYKDPLSDNMRARLMREASTGLDSEQKQTNVILYISLAVAVLVILGGSGILY